VFQASIKAHPLLCARNERHMLSMIRSGNRVAVYCPGLLGWDAWMCSWNTYFSLGITLDLVNIVHLMSIGL